MNNSFHSNATQRYNKGKKKRKRENLLNQQKMFNLKFKIKEKGKYLRTVQNERSDKKPRVKGRE